MAADDVSNPFVTAPRRRYVLWFCLVWAVLTAVLSPLATALQQRVSWPDPDVLNIVTLAPAVAAGITWCLFRRWPPFPLRPVDRRAVLRLRGLALVWVVVDALVLAGFTGSFGTVPADVAGTPVVAVLAVQVLAALGEEIGYRGVLLTGLLVRFRPAVAGTVDGVLFGVVHIARWGDGAASLGWFVVSAVGLVVAMTALFDGSLRQRWGTTTVVHFGANVALFVVARDAATWQWAVAAWSATLVVIAVRRRRRPAPVRRRMARVASIYS